MFNVISIKDIVEHFDQGVFILDLMIDLWIFIHMRNKETKDKLYFQGELLENL